jgi:hypothetical protein
MQLIDVAAAGEVAAPVATHLLHTTFIFLPHTARRLWVCHSKKLKTKIKPKATVTPPPQSVHSTPLSASRPLAPYRRKENRTDSVFTEK